MEALKSFSSRMLLNKDDDEKFEQEISAIDREWVINYCKNLNEWNESVVMLWIKKIKSKDYKRVKRMVAITPHRFITVQKNGDQYNVKRESHLLDLLSLKESGLVLTIKFRDFIIAFQCAQETLVLQVLQTMYKNYQLINPGFPPDLTASWLNQYDTSQAEELGRKVPVRAKDKYIWERPLRAFESYCSFYQDSSSESLVNGFRSMVSKEVSKDDERWIRTQDLAIQNPKVLYGLLISISFTQNLIDGVEISSNSEFPELIDAVRTLIKYNYTLKSCILDKIGQSSPDWGRILFEGLNNNQKSQLIRFGMQNCKLGEKGLNNWIEGNKKLSRQPECIYVTSANASPKQMILFIQSLHGKSDVTSGIVELDLSDNILEGKGTQILASRLSKDFQGLKRLNLAKCHIDIPRLLDALYEAQNKNVVKLEELDISYNKMSQRDGLELSRLLAKSGTTACLGIAGCGLTGEIIAAITASLVVNEKLQYYVRLDASDNNIGNDNAVVLASIFANCDRLMQIKLNNCDLGHEGMGYILFSLQGQPRLRILELDNNCKREEWTTGKYHVNQELKNLLERCLNLESLSLKNDPERGYQVDLDHFLQALKINSSLISLDITGNSMTNDNLTSLKDVVIKNQTLQELHWDLNNITSRHIIAVTHSLKQNQTLQLVEFPEQDFQKEMLVYGKDQKKRMELELVKKNFYKALFENNTAAGFQASPVSIKRKSAKRASVLGDSPVNKNMFQYQAGSNTLNLPPPPSW